MYRISPNVRQFATALLGGVGVATIWVNLAPGGYYDVLEYRLADVALPGWTGAPPVIVTPMAVVSQGLMALFVAFIGKELWEAMVLERGPWPGPHRAALPIGAILGGMAGAAAVWVLWAALFETAEEARLGTGWAVPLGGDVVLGYVIGRMVFGTGHPALHLLLLIALGQDILGLAVLGVTRWEPGWRMLWLVPPLAAALGLHRGLGPRIGPGATERDRQVAQALWPYVVAGAVSWLGVALAGLPPALGLLPILPAIPHAGRSFGVFAEAERLLHDPLNHLAGRLALLLPVVLFAFGLVRGGVDFGAWAPTTGTVLAALWIGKPLGILAGGLSVVAALRGALPPGVTLRDLVLIAVILGAAFTMPALALEMALPGGGMTEAARLGLALSLLAAPGAIVAARALRRPG